MYNDSYPRKQRDDDDANLAMLHFPWPHMFRQGARAELGLGRWTIPLVQGPAAGHVWSLQRLCAELGTGLHGA